jgi:predicted Zn finger-like uncharacterized protein
MIITCSCGVRLKVADEKLTAAGVKIKCPKCATVHVARKDVAAPAPSAATAPPAQASAPAMPWFAGSSPVADQGKGGSLVLVAHDSTVVADMITSVLKDAGMTTDYAPNGLEALKKATELKPQVMVVDVGLTGIYGFELCERLKGDKATKHIKIILLSSVYGLTAYKRSPVTLYGADDYIEKHHIPDQLVPKLKRLLYGEAEAAPTSPPEQERTEAPPAPLVSRKGVVQQAPTAAPPPPPAAPEPRPVPPPAPPEPKRGFEMPEIPSILPKTPVTLGGETAAPRRPVPAASAPLREEPVAPPASVQPAEVVPEQADGSVKLDAGFFEHEEYEAPAKPAAKAAAADPIEVEKARRFARLIVSDIALYNQESVAEGIKNGTLFELLKDDIAEGRNLYESRVPTAILETKDYLQEAFDNFIASKKKLR